MSYANLLPPLESKIEPRWKPYVTDSLLALSSTLLLTGLIYLLHLYPLIPDTLLLYLLVILALASLRGLYAALLASCIAFFSFDFFFVPPLYSFIAIKFEDILALVVFLATSITTGQLASALRQRAEDANRRERETRILYNLVHATNRENDVEHQLHIFVRTLVEVFTPWGIRDCILFLPDTTGTFVPQISIHQPCDQIQFSAEETAIIAQVVSHARAVDIRENQVTLSAASHKTIAETKQHAVQRTSYWYVRLLPLKTNQQVVGILRLLIEDNQYRADRENNLPMERGQSTPQALFFSTFLEQGVTLIERGRLLRETVSVKVLQQTDALRAALLSSVSHDLRTPLSAIKTAGTSLLQDDIRRDEEAVSSFASVITHESDRLNRLVENLLDMSRIEAGALHPKKVWYPLDELIMDVLGRMRPLLQERVVSIHFPEDLLPVELDYVQIDQVLTNLLENAIYYTPATTPLDVNVEMLDKQVMVSVADRGPGIFLADREHIFDKFYRVHGEPSASYHPRGSGLGLAVCRGLIEAHGGCIWMEAREGGGAVFRFTLPQGKIEEESDEQRKSSHSHR